MSIITLTSDFGYKDPHIGVIKGNILKQNREIQIVDITHDVEPFNLPEAAYIIKNTYHHFPDGSIHIIAINTTELNQRFLAVSYNQHCFLTPDNGILSLIIADNVQQIVELEGNENLKTFPSWGVLIPAACKLASGKTLLEIGTQTNQYEQRGVLQPTVQQTNIRGSIIYIDRYGNAVTNISKELFDTNQLGRAFIVYFKRETISEISENYHVVPDGEKLCLFNANKHLEVAIKFGSAADLFGFNIGDTIQIDFI